MCQERSFLTELGATRVEACRTVDSGLGNVWSIKSDASEPLDALVDKRARPVRQQIRTGIDDVYGNWLGLELFQQVFELAVFSVRSNLIGKKHTETQSINAGVQGAVDLVAADHADDWDRHIAPADLESRKESSMLRALPR
jgi:hypothetical protein